MRTKGTNQGNDVEIALCAHPNIGGEGLFLLCRVDRVWRLHVRDNSWLDALLVQRTEKRVSYHTVRG